LKKFISFEGIDGSGKSTQARLLAIYLNTNNIPNILTREPGGSYLAEKIRNLIINDDMDETTQFFLFYAARRDHLIQTIIPALDAGKIVICDRFVDSTRVYQGNLMSGLHKAAETQALSIGFEEPLYPALTLLLDIKPDMATERLRARGNLNTFDMKSQEEKENDRRAFIYEAKAENRFVVIDANRNEQTIHQEIVKIVKEKFFL